MADTANKTPPVSVAEAKRRERARVKAIIERDKADRMREIERAAAQLKMEDGKAVSLSDATIDPTPEWFQHGDTETFTPELPDGTVNVLKAHRRVLTPIVLRMLRADKIDSDQYRALKWYAECYEIAGLHGNIPIVQIGREVFGGGPDRVLFTETQQQAQKLLRQVQSVITPHRVRFFEAVVIGNVPIERAAKFVRTRRGNALNIFKNEAQKVTVAVEALGILA